MAGHDKRKKRLAQPTKLAPHSAPDLMGVQAAAPPTHMVQRALREPTSASPDTIRYLQSAYGNRFVQGLLGTGQRETGNQPGQPAVHTPPVSPVVQRSPLQSLSPARGKVIQRNGYGPLPDDPVERQREIRRRIRARQEKEHNDKYGWFGSKTLLGSFASMFSYGNHEQEESVEYQLNPVSGVEEVQDDFDEEEEQEGMFSLKKIEINLKEAEFESGNMRGKGELKGGMEGLKAEGELAYDGTQAESSQEERSHQIVGQNVTSKRSRRRAKGRRAKASAEVNVSPEKVEGKGEVAFEWGDSSKVAGTLGWDMIGSHFEGGGSVNSFSGAKLGAKARGSYDRDSGGFAAKGKASAFLGESVDVKVKVGSADVGTFKGSAGFSYGIGGELSGEITWSGGKLTLAGKGKAAVGPGLSLGYNVEINTQSLSRGFYNWLSRWGGWALEVLDSGDEPLLL
jgi:hypothetical protein